MPAGAPVVESRSTAARPERSLGMAARSGRRRSPLWEPRLLRFVLSLTCIIVALGALLVAPHDGPAGRTPPTRVSRPSEIGPGASRISPGSIRWRGPSAQPTPPRPARRSSVSGPAVTWAGDTVGVARLNAIFAAEGFRRSRMVLDRWIPRIDPGTGLIPTDVLPDGHKSGRTAIPARTSIPTSTIAAHLLAPQYDPLFVGVLEAERKLGPAVPDDVTVPAASRSGSACRSACSATPSTPKTGSCRWWTDSGQIRGSGASSKSPTRSSPPPRRPPAPRDAARRLHRGQRRRPPVLGPHLLGDRQSQVPGGRQPDQPGPPPGAAPSQHLPARLQVGLRQRRSPHRRRFRLSDHGNEILPACSNGTSPPPCPATPRPAPTASRSAGCSIGSPTWPQPGRPLDARHRYPLWPRRARGLLGQLGVRCKRS